MTEQGDSRRAELIAAAQARWVDALTDLGGNGSWLAPSMVPNTIRCNERPQVVPPPPPSGW